MTRLNTFFLEPVSPFRLDLTVWALRRRPENIVDRWDGQTYRRVLPLQGGPVAIEVIQVGPPESPRLQISVEGQNLCPNVKATVASTLEQMLGIRIDLTKFYQLVASDKQLQQLVQRFKGMKPPRYGTVFESLITGIATQQVSRTVSILILNRLIANYGVKSQDAHAFPRPEELAGLLPTELRPLGFSRQKGRAIIELAKLVVEGGLELEKLTQLSDEEAIERLCNLRGVGRWTAGYVLLRGLGRTSIFPGDEVGVGKNLKRWLHLEKPLDYETVHHTLECWHPYGGLIYFHMLLNRLAEAGLLQDKI